ARSTLSLHDALPIYPAQRAAGDRPGFAVDRLDLELRLEVEDRLLGVRIDDSVGLARTLLDPPSRVQVVERLLDEVLMYQRLRLSSEEHTSELQSLAY